MKLYFILVIVFFLNNCSFDNKSGIWDNEKNITEENNDQFKDFEKISSSQDIFNKIVPLTTSLKIKLPSLTQPEEWNEIFYKNNNNYVNFEYSYLNQVALKTKKLTKYTTGEYILFSKNNLIFYESKSFGNDYAKTLSIWKSNFFKNWLKIEKLGFDNNFKRLYGYLL